MAEMEEANMGIGVAKGPQQETPDNIFLHMGSREEAVLPGVGGRTGGSVGGFHSLLDTPIPHHFLQVPRESSLVGK